MQSFKRTLVAGAIALGLAAPASAQYSNIYFFGDSLTDTGSFKPVLPPGTGLFTTNPGPVYPVPFASALGFTATPANQGGNDFAEGGARVTQLPGVPNSAPTGTAAPVATQVSNYLARGPADPNALYVIWAGANDITVQLGLAGAGLISPAQAQAGVATAAAELVGQVARLQAAGARYIVVFNLPDVGRTPAGTASGAAGTLTALSTLFNTTLSSALDQTGIQALRLNIFGLLNEMIANPALFGFSNATALACGATDALLCTPANLVTPNAAQTFVFADGKHPTTAGHALIAQYIEAALAGPQQMAALAEAPLAVQSASWRSLDGRMLSATNAPGRGRVEAWVTYDYANPDMNSGFLSGDGKLDTISVGADIKLSSKLLVGAAFGYTENRVDFSQSGFKLKESTGTLYAGYGQGPWYLGATVGASDLDYKDVHRDITLGALTRRESGTTRGYATTARLLGGYWFNVGGSLLHGPSLRYTYQDIKVRAFSEDGSSSTTMNFDQQRRKSGIASLGWQVAGTFGSFRPFARASWEIETKDDERQVGASIVGMGGRFTVPAYRPDKDYALFTVGAATDIGRVTAFVSGEATGGKSDGNGYAITVGMRVPL